MSLTVVQSSVDKTQLRNIIEAALLAAGEPLNESALMGLFGTVDPPPRDTLREVIVELKEEYEGRGIELAEVASGWRVQVRADMAPALSRLWESRPPRFSRALLETLCLIAYRQPITRGEIEDVRGVSVSVNIVRTLMDRHWIRVVGHRDVPGKPEMFGTTREFLDYFGLKGLDDLPTLAELKDFDEPNGELDFEPPIETQIALDENDANADQNADQNADANADESASTEQEATADEEQQQDVDEPTTASMDKGTSEQQAAQPDCNENDEEPSTSAVADGAERA